LVSAVGGIVAGGVQEGAVRSDFAPEVLATFLLGMLRARSRDLEEAERISHDAVVDLFLTGAGASGRRHAAD
jgi:hypothetical protein